MNALRAPILRDVVLHLPGERAQVCNLDAESYLIPSIDCTRAQRSSMLVGTLAACGGSSGATRRADRARTQIHE